MPSVLASKLDGLHARAAACLAPAAARGAPTLQPAAGGLVLAVVCGALIAAAGVNGLYLCASLLGGALILVDFRVGVVLLILLMPISESHVFPHQMFGITGLNPLNLLLIATLGAYLLKALFDGEVSRFVPPRLWWLYVAPIIVGGLLGIPHVKDIVPGFYIYHMINFDDVTGYLRDMLIKPLLMVVFALLVAAAAAHSEKPQRFLIPAVLSMWIMALLVIVFVYLSGGVLDKLARSTSRAFLSPLGIHANQLGRLYAASYALLLFTWARTQQRLLRAVLAASMLLLIAALLLTFSRGAFGDFLVVNLLYLWWHRSTKYLFVVGVVALLALFVLPGVYDAVYDRVTMGFGRGLNAVTAGRLNGLWIPLFPEVLKSPLYGSGLSSILWCETMHKAGGTAVIPATHPHNAYLKTLMDMGVLGLTLLCAYYYGVWKRFRALAEDVELSPILRGFYEGAAAGLISFLIAALTDSALTPKPEEAFLWLAIGMMYGQLRKQDARRGGAR